MRAIAEQDLLAAWDEALPQHPIDRVLTLLAALGPSVPRAELWGLEVGERDARLRALREQLFGPDLRASAACPACGLDLEVTTPLGALRAAEAAPPRAASPGEEVVEAAGVTIRFRRVDSRDLAAVSDAPDAQAARAALLARIIVDARTTGETPAAAADLPEAAVAAVEARLAELDAAADVTFELRCPDCSQAWSAPFDPGAYLWHEIDVWARRILRSVDTLARAYGWTESEVLALGPGRRRFYLELAAE